MNINCDEKSGREMDMGRRRCALVGFVLVLMFVLSVGPVAPVGASADHAAVSASIPIAAAITPEDVRALDVLYAYYDAVNTRDYWAAYNLLGSQTRKQQTYARFTAGFSHTAYDYLDWSTITVANKQWQIAVTLSALQTDGTYQFFRGVYTVGYDSGDLRILTATLERE